MANQESQKQPSAAEVNQQLEIKKKVEQEVEKRLGNYNALQELTGYKSEMISVMHKVVAKGTSVAELAYFLSVCKGMDLNPLNKEIWCYKDNKGNLLVFTGRDGFLKKNKQNPKYKGMRSSEVMEFDEFEIDMIEGTVKHKITTNRGKQILGAYCIVFVEGQKDTIVYLDFDEFNLDQAKWKTSPKMMIKKCAQSLALKEAAGITGIQAEEAFVVHNGAAVSASDLKEEQPKNHESERLELLIQNAKNLEQLKGYLQYCDTPELVELYEEKKNEFE